MTLPTAQGSALLRTDLWRLLALAFDRPTVEGLDALRGLLDDLLDADATAPLAEPLIALRDTIPHLDVSLLEQEYHLLFTTQMLATPNESSYHRTGRGAVIGDISAFFRAFGLHLRAEQGAADSVRNEIAFLAFLGMKEVHAMEKGLADELVIVQDATRAFLADHLGRWAAAFVERLLGATVTPFYIEAGALLMAVLNHVTAELGVRDVPPLAADGAPAEPDVMPCAAAGVCIAGE